MSRLALLLAALALAGCGRNPAEAVAPSSNVHFQVGRLFTHEGCTVYRFVDGVHHRYYVRCDGGHAAAHFDHTEQCGKNCTRTIDNAIQTIPGAQQ